jgi:2-amino-4-hydroxy-6-hydroxymethyldihydropteridine diphosphokinase
VTAVVLSVGSNLGDRLENLRIPVLQAAYYGLRLRCGSPVYETAPIGGPPQPPYLNAVLLADTELPPYAVLAAAHAVEQSAGRQRGQRWGPRTLDVDIVAYGEQAYIGPPPGSGLSELTIPHPRAAERAFVLVPWLDADPDAVLPGRGRVAELVRALDLSGVRRRDDLDLARPAG